MKENSFTVSFEQHDMPFLKKYGLFKAMRKVRNHNKKYKVPFIDDTYQLAHALSITRKQLFDLSRNANKHYKQILLKKRKGGVRVINAPDPELKDIQRRILRRILYKSEISKYATAYAPDRKLKDNATPHVNHKYLLKMDITDFFGSITFLEVISSAFNSKIYPTQIGAMLTALCCKDEVLPQGAPTSPMLSNIVMKNFDNAIGGWCEKRDITYTRYCDDLTFSADIPLYNVYQKVEDMLIQRGFEVNESKTKFITNSGRQTVTGLTVNEKVSIPRDYKRQLRQEIYYALKFGLSESIVYGNKTEFMDSRGPNCWRYYQHLKGKLNYVFQVEPNNMWFRDADEKLWVAYIQPNMRYPY